MYKRIVTHLFNKAKITINGQERSDIKVKNQNFYKRVLFNGSLGLGESYMDGWWECEAIDELIYKILKVNLDRKIFSLKSEFFNNFKARFLNLQKKSKAFEIGKKHYDRGNELFENMLDKYMNYSCGYWKDAENLDEAQINKMELICSKLYLKGGEKILDIGCGFGGFLKMLLKDIILKGLE